MGPESRHRREKARLRNFQELKLIPKEAAVSLPVFDINIELLEDKS